jgi:hypothetical protein
MKEVICFLRVCLPVVQRWTLAGIEDELRLREDDGFDLLVTVGGSVERLWHSQCTFYIVDILLCSLIYVFDLFHFFLISVFFRSDRRDHQNSPLEAGWRLRRTAKTSRTITPKKPGESRLTRWDMRARLSGEEESQNGNSGSMQQMASSPIKVIALLAFGLAGALSGTAQNGSSPAPQSALSSKHTITVNFDYDFSKTPACSKTVTKACIQQFIVYDISAGLAVRTKLFSIPVPPGETKLVKGLTGKSPLLLFESGKHRIAVTAQMAGGKESDIDASITWVEVPASENKLVAAPK